MLYSATVYFGAAFRSSAGARQAMVLLVVLNYLVILPMTWVTLRLLRVPEHLELIAGGLLAFSYGVLGTALSVGLL